MTKTWEFLTVEEKVEELRKDIVRTMGAVNNLALFRERATSEIGNIHSELQKLQSRLAALEAKKG